MLMLSLSSSCGPSDRRYLYLAMPAAAPYMKQCLEGGLRGRVKAAQSLLTVRWAVRWAQHTQTIPLYNLQELTVHTIHNIIDVPLRPEQVGVGYDIVCCLYCWLQADSKPVWIRHRFSYGRMFPPRWNSPQGDMLGTVFHCVC